MKVVGVLEPEPPVRQEYERPQGIDVHFAGAERQEHQRRRHAGEGEDHSGGRDDAPNPVAVETPKRHGSGVLCGAHQIAGDEEPGDHEEHVDTNEPTARPAPQVAREHGKHRDHPQALDVESLMSPCCTSAPTPRFLPIPVQHRQAPEPRRLGGLCCSCGYVPKPSGKSRSPSGRADRRENNPRPSRSRLDHHCWRNGEREPLTCRAFPSAVVTPCLWWRMR